MSRNNIKTKLSDNPHAPPSTDMEGHVESQELDYLCSVFGNENGNKLFQAGTDVAEVKEWQSLDEKFSQYLPKPTTVRNTTPKSEPAMSAEGSGNLSAPMNSLDKYGQYIHLKDAVQRLSKLAEANMAEITRLKAVIPKNPMKVAVNAPLS